MACCTLRKIPEDVVKYLLQEQKRIKEEKEVKVYSIELTIYHIIRELKKCREEGK